MIAAVFTEAVTAFEQPTELVEYDIEHAVGVFPVRRSDQIGPADFEVRGGTRRMVLSDRLLRSEPYSDADDKIIVSKQQRGFFANGLLQRCASFSKSRANMSALCAFVR